MTGCFWAPELHVIGGKLSVLFMPCFDGPRVNPDGTPNDRAGKPDMWTGSCHIMQLKQHSDGTDFDPREPENWTVPEPILDPDGETLNPIQRISLDMTVLCDTTHGSRSAASGSPALTRLVRRGSPASRSRSSCRNSHGTT